MDDEKTIKPANWKVPPDKLDDGWPTPLRQVFRLVWDSALACSMKPPLLIHRRYTYCATDDATVVALASVGVDRREGYWKIRKDYPVWDFPTVPTTQLPPPLPRLRVERTRPVYVPGATMGRLLRELEHRGVASAKDTVAILKGLIETQPNRLCLAQNEGAEQALTMGTAQHCGVASGDSGEEVLVHIVQQLEGQGGWHVRVKVEGSGQPLVGFVAANLASIAPAQRLTEENARRLGEKLEGKIIERHGAHNIAQVPGRYPANTLLTTLARAADELNLAPWESMCHLESLRQEGLL